MTATATAHTRGTVAKAPADFKHVIASVLGGKSIRKQWTRFMTGLAMSYRQQGKCEGRVTGSFGRQKGLPTCRHIAHLACGLMQCTVLMDYSCFRSYVDNTYGKDSISGEVR